MTTTLKILQGNSTEKFICDSDILEIYSEDSTRELHWNDRYITWNSIWDILKWVESENIEIKKPFYFP